MHDRGQAVEDLTRTIQAFGIGDLIRRAGHELCVLRIRRVRGSATESGEPRLERLAG